MTQPGKQQGITLIGFVFVLAFLLMVAYIGMKVVPVYISYFSVMDAINEVVAEPGIGGESTRAIRDKISKRLYVNYAEGLTPESIRVVRTRNGKEIQVNYDVTEHIAGNLSVCIHFEKSIYVR